MISSIVLDSSGSSVLPEKRNEIHFNLFIKSKNKVEITTFLTIFTKFIHN